MMYFSIIYLQLYFYFWVSEGKSIAGLEMYCNVVCWVMLCSPPLEFCPDFMFSLIWKLVPKGFSVSLQRQILIRTSVLHQQQHYGHTAHKAHKSQIPQNEQLVFGTNFSQKQKHT